MEKERAYEIWTDLFGDVDVAYDFASHPMRKADFQNKDSHYGWDIDEKKPFLAQKSNLLPCSLNTMGFRQGKSSFKVGNHLFEVRKGRQYGTFSIYDITERNNPINMDPTVENQNPEYNRKRFHEIAVSRNNIASGFHIPSLKSIQDNVINEKIAVQDDFFFEDEKEETKEEILPNVGEPVPEEKVEESPALEEQNASQETEEVKTEEVQEEPISEEAKNEPVMEEKAEEMTVEQEEAPSITEDPDQEENASSIIEEHPLLEDESYDETQEEVPSLEQTHVEEEKDVSFIIEDLKKRIEQNEKEIASLKESNNSIEQEKNSLADKNDQIREENESIRKEIIENQKQIQEILAANEALKNEIRELSTQTEEKKASYENLRQEKEQLENELSLSKESNVLLSGQINELQEKEKASKMSLSSLEKEKAELEEKILSLNSALEEIKNQEEQQNRIDSDKNNQILSEMNQMKAELQEKENVIASLVKKKEEMTIQKDALESSLQEEKGKEEESKKNYDELLLKHQNLVAEYDQLNAQSELSSDQMASVNDENKNLSNQIKELNTQIEEANRKNQDVLFEKDSLVRQMNETKEKMLSLNSELEFIKNEKMQLSADKTLLNATIDQMKSNLEISQKKNADSLSTLQSEIDGYKNELEALKNEKTLLQDKVLYLSLNGKEEGFLSMRNELLSRLLPFDEENILSSFKEHPEWKKEFLEDIETIQGESSLVLEEEVSYAKEDQERKKRALNYYDQIFSMEKNEVSDFAGRFIRMTDYQNKNSDYGWNFFLLDPHGEEKNDNIAIANLKSIADYHFDIPFKTNGNEFIVKKIGERNKILSSDYISDPYDFSQALRVTKKNQEKKSPLIYLFVKVLGVSQAQPEKEALMEFFDLMDCTVKRICPTSFVEMKTVLGNGCYAFVTFSSNGKDAYREVLDYAVLLNSYRREYRSREKLNAVIVLNEVDVEFSKRHLDYDALLNETKDDELRTLRYEFNLAVINSTIKRTIHIGPRILDKLPLDQNMLKPSNIGQGNFAKMYRFDKEFKIYNFIYSLTHKEEETQE